jgi:hypothetical protein
LLAQTSIVMENACKITAIRGCHKMYSEFFFQ